MGRIWIRIGIDIGKIGYLRRGRTRRGRIHGGFGHFSSGRNKEILVASCDSGVYVGVSDELLVFSDGLPRGFVIFDCDFRGAAAAATRWSRWRGSVVDLASVVGDHT
jgi:hypothetical protein